MSGVLFALVVGGVWAGEQPPPIPTVDIRAQVHLRLDKARDEGTADTLPDDLPGKAPAVAVDAPADDNRPAAGPATKPQAPASPAERRQTYVPLPNAIITIQDMGDIKRLAAEIDKAKKKAGKGADAGASAGTP